MTTPSRSVGLELTVANKPQFLSEMEEIAQQVNSLFKINLPGGSGLASAPSMPTPPSQEAAPPSYLGTVNPTVPVQPAQSQAQLHQQTVARMPNGVPTTVPQPQRPSVTGTMAGQLGHGYHRFRHVTGTLLPMYGSLLGVEAIGAGYQTASSLAVQAGQIGMNTGGNNPTSVFNQLTTAGKSQAIPPSSLAQTVQQQGFASGTSNLAFLFKDATQTAMFARSLGIGTGQAAQIMGSYQLSGAFQPGQEAGTAAQIAAATKVSGMNSSAFLSGVQQLALAGQRTGVQTDGGVATSLAMVNRLGASLNMPLLQNANGVQTLQTLQQGWSAGPGAQSGLYASQMMPLYSAVEKSMAPVYKKMGFGGLPELASLMQTNIADYPKQMLAPLLTAMHKELTAPGLTGTTKQMTELGMSQFLFGNINASSLQNINKLAQNGPGFNLTATEKAIKDAQGTLKTNNQTYLGSIAGDVSKIQTTVESILAKIGGTAIKAGAAVAPAAGAHPGLTGALTVGASLATTFTPYMLMRRLVGSGGAFGGGLTSAVGAGAGDAAIGTGLAAGAVAAGTSLAAGLALVPWNKKDVKNVPHLLAQSHDTSLYQVGRFGPGANDNFTHVAETSLAAGGHPLQKTPSTSAYQLGRFGPGVNDAFTHAAQQSLATRIYPVHVSVQSQSPTPGGPNSGNGLGYAAMSQIGGSWLGYTNNFSQILGQSPGSSGKTLFGPSLPPSQTYSGSGVGQFINTMKPYALQTAQKMGVPSQYQSNVAQFLLAEWGKESGWGTSAAALKNDNFGGIKPPGSGQLPGLDNKYAGYSSLANWASGDAYFFSHNSYYSKFLQAAKSGASPATLATLLGQTPYASDPNYGSSIVQGFLPSVQAGYNSTPSKRPRPSANHNINRKHYKMTAG